MSDDKDDLRTIIVYKFNNTIENWHEFALKFRVIADSMGCEDVIDGTVFLPDENDIIEVLPDYKAPERKAKREAGIKASKYDGFERLGEVNRWHILEYC